MGGFRNRRFVSVDHVRHRETALEQLWNALEQGFSKPLLDRSRIRIRRSQLRNGLPASGACVLHRWPGAPRGGAMEIRKLVVAGVPGSRVLRRVCIARLPSI